LRSVPPEDLLIAERHHPERIGQIYRLRHNPAHECFWFPNMRREEAVVFTVYDSAKDGRATEKEHGSARAGVLLALRQPSPIRV
jgi:hypothetical protein